MAKLTPMQAQYRKIKAEHEDCLLFFRLGDFYEMFDDDAKTVSRELELTLTTRDRNKPKEEQTPMCGVPYHSCEAYIGRLIARGYKVAICEQLDEPKRTAVDRNGSIVDRAVIRIITPGTLVDASMLDEGSPNYLGAVFLEGETAAVAFCDISTGEFCLSSFDKNAVSRVVNELGRFKPRELIINQAAQDVEVLRDFLRIRVGCMTHVSSTRFDYTQAAMLCCAQFNVPSVDHLGLYDYQHSVCAAGALLSYIMDTQKMQLSNIRGIDVFTEGRFMELDHSTMRNLELCENLRDGGVKDTLLDTLDRTKTPMGKRLLRAFITRPLNSAMAIRARHEAVEELVNELILRTELRSSLRNIGDMQRIISRITVGVGGARELSMLGNYMQHLTALVLNLRGVKSPLLNEMRMMDAMCDLHKLICETICDDPPVSVREGGMICDEYDERLDHLREVSKNGAKMLAELEAREREATGIKTLKIGYNRVFGYYINVPNSANSENLPERYIRKQTLASSERYFTEELKTLENDIINAKDEINDLEYEFFVQLRDEIAKNASRVQETAGKVAILDVLCSFAEDAVRENYCRPQIDLSNDLHIVDGRHPVVEMAQRERGFVPNDVHMDLEKNRLAIITGPNMAGKSTYMRQCALIVLMAQIGSFVPAKSATIGIVDRVFTRIGASDDLSSGQSTFMVEMSEMANILACATSSSLLILDEVGRGTSTYDGMAIARAIAQHCADRKSLGAKTMFATHYHELSALEHKISGVFNCNISAKKQNGKLIFLRKIVAGAADESYGIEVAKLAGVPEKITRNAERYLRELESILPVEDIEVDDQLSFSDVAEDGLKKKLQELAVDELSPRAALDILYELKKEAEQI